MRADHRITPHFTLGEVTARWRGDKRVPAADLALLLAHPRKGLLLAALERVCHVAEEIRALVGEPVFVTSGYRYLDAAERPTSQHQVGQALDLQVRSLTPRQLLALVSLRLRTPLRQVIAETTRNRAALDERMAEGSGGWLHIAVLGVGGEDFTRASALPWAESWAPEPGQRRPYVAV